MRNFGIQAANSLHKLASFIWACINYTMVGSIFAETSNAKCKKWCPILGKRNQIYKIMLSREDFNYIITFPKWKWSKKNVARVLLQSIVDYDLSPQFSEHRIMLWFTAHLLLSKWPIFLFWKVHLLIPSEMIIQIYMMTTTIESQHTKISV